HQLANNIIPRRQNGCESFLLCSCDFGALSACAVHFVGYLRYSADALAPDSPLAAYRFSCLGDAYGTASLAVSFNPARELARSHSWRPAVQRWVPAPLPGQAGLPGISSTLLTVAGVIICALNLAFYGRQVWIARYR